jgi:hypothetical protein
MSRGSEHTWPGADVPCGTGPLPGAGTSHSPAFYRVNRLLFIATHPPSGGVAQALHPWGCSCAG